MLGKKNVKEVLGRKKRKTIFMGKSTRIYHFKKKKEVILKA